MSGAMTMETLSAEDFLPHVGHQFRLAGADSPHTLELLSVTPARRAVPGHRTGFSLLFRGALPKVPEQTVLQIVHPTRGELGLFVVPVAQDADGVQYEAIFN
jgi:hypothetical protein